MAERGPMMIRDFASASLREACRVASSGLSPREAIERFNEITRYESAAGLAIDMGRRAVARCAAERGDSTRFVAELFSEAVSYYASRDLPSYIASAGRVASSSEAIHLKDSLREVTRQQVESVGRPDLNADRWGEYVARVLRTLQGGGKPE